ncbi:Hypothetical predicted protein [Pelobates cultripes]|uniref:Uncharacterized protein n=1 Tax=Pelobates cultripes TaxID=61616 RepID=A0AAD1W019_PELCU|nr:Hypothetical predicted protein [Pelobates cultripes]
MASSCITKNTPPLDLESGNVSGNWAKWSDQQKAAYFISVGHTGCDVCRAWCASGHITAEGKKKTEAESSGQYVHLGLLNNRATPLEVLCSPEPRWPFFQRNFSHRVLHMNLLQLNETKTFKNKSDITTNQPNRFAPLTLGQAVRHKINGKKWEPARIVRVSESPRSNVIENPRGQELRRNRWHLRTDFSSSATHNSNDDEIPSTPVIESKLDSHTACNTEPNDTEGTMEFPDASNVEESLNAHSDTRDTHSSYGHKRKPKI